MKEREYRNKLIKILSNEWHIEKEVEGFSEIGGKCRVDLVITPKNTDEWKHKGIAFAVEIKSPYKLKDDLNDFTKWIAQSIDYSYTSFDGYGRIPVLLSPGLIHRHIEVVDSRMIAKHLLGQFLIGELRPMPYRGLSIVMNTKDVIWSERKGVEQGKRWNITHKFGRR